MEMLNQANDGASGDIKTSPLDRDFEDLVQRTMEKWHIQGLAIAVVDGDKTWTEVCNQDSPNTSLTEQ